MEDFSYDIKPEDTLAVVLQQRNSMFDQLTTAQVELFKARTIITFLNNEKVALQNSLSAATAPAAKQTKTQVKKAA